MSGGYFEYNAPTVTTNNTTYVTCTYLSGKAGTGSTINKSENLITFKAACKNYTYAKITIAYGYYSNYGDYKITYTAPGGSAVTLANNTYAQTQSGGILTTTITVNTSNLSSAGTSVLAGTLYLYNRSSNTSWWVCGGIGIQKIELTNTA